MDQTRINLDRLIREHGEDYLSISRMLGRNSAYIQQFMKRGTPRKLDEDDRRTLARFFGVDERDLGAPADMPVSGQGFVLVPKLRVDVSAGPGSHAEDEASHGRIGFDPVWLRKLGGDPKFLSMIHVKGDSMTPTLNNGDEILVDTSDGNERARDGIYVLRIDDALVVKRLSVHPATRRYAIKSDNPAYPGWPDCDPASVDVVGRVLWAGRKLS